MEVVEEVDVGWMGGGAGGDGVSRSGGGVSSRLGEDCSHFTLVSFLVLYLSNRRVNEGSDKSFE